MNRTDAVTGQIYISQDIAVVEGALYAFSGWAYKDDATFDWAKLRLDWRDSPGSLLTVDSPLLAEDQAVYQFLSIDSEQAPINAIVARVEDVAHIVSPNPSIPVFFDELTFALLVLPTPTPTPIPTPSCFRCTSLSWQGASSAIQYETGIAVGLIGGRVPW